MMEYRVLNARYVSNCKVRSGHDRSAVVWIDGEWRAIIPETALRDWFGAEAARPNETVTLYATLGVKADVTGDVVRSAYRRLARQWHPDVCKEPDATEQFRRIQHAYEVLRNQNTRIRYDAGLALQANAQEQGRKVAGWREALGTIDAIGYRSPLRCGMIMTHGAQRGRWFIVEQLLAWEDVTNDAGQVLVTSWPMGSTEPWEAWV